jgi:uncharacterized protein (TIGR02301 family)
MVALGVVMSCAAFSAPAADSRVNDIKLNRLSEILGAVHYLRELCGAVEGTAWRDAMQSLLESQATSALRRVELTANFNKGYRSYRRTYQSCTGTADTVVTRFLLEGADIADQLAAKK